MGGRIANLKKELREIIEPDIKLLTSLTSKCGLTVEKRNEIWNCANVHDRADKLVCWLEHYSGDYNNVKVAFNKAIQEHVANFIIADGGISSLFLSMSD